MTAGGGFRWPPAKYKAFIASIVDVFHRPLSEIARLTDRQLIEIYNHPRDKDGRIKEPEEKASDTTPAVPPSLERDLCQLAALAGMMRIPAEKYAVMKRQLEEKWAAKTTEAGNG